MRLLVARHTFQNVHTVAHTQTQAVVGHGKTKIPGTGTLYSRAKLNDVLPILTPPVWNAAKDRVRAMNAGHVTHTQSRHMSMLSCST